MNLKDQLKVQRMYSNQIDAKKTVEEKKDDEIKKLKNKVRQQNHVINNTNPAQVGKL